MNKEVAREYLQVPNGKLPSEIGEAVDVVVRRFRFLYSNWRVVWMCPPGYLGDRHHIFQLPKGISMEKSIVRKLE